MLVIKDIDTQKGTVIVADEAKSTFTTYPLSCFRFSPSVGDVVKVYTSSTSSDVFVEKEGNTIDSTFEEEKQTGTRQINKWVYLLLALVFGIFGFQYFYAGDIARGRKYILMTVLLGWTGIIPIALYICSVIDGCAVAGKPVDAHGFLL